MWKKRWKLLGFVGVDSGQLMISDPCYLNGWDKESHYEDIRKFEDIETGEIFQYRKDFKTFEEMLEQYDGKTPNELIYLYKRWKVIPYEPKYNFGYNYISHYEGYYPSDLLFEKLVLLLQNASLRIQKVL